MFEELLIISTIYYCFNYFVYNFQFVFKKGRRKRKK